MIHPTAILYPNVFLEEDVEIGPYCVIGGDAQHRSAPTRFGVRIGAGAIIREHVTIHAGTERVTTIGRRCYIMAGAHVSHDGEIGDDVTLAMRVTLGGHVWVGGGANLGIGTVVHQRGRVGALAMVGMASVVTRTRNVPDFAKAYGAPAIVHGVNEVGLRRAGWTEGQITEAARRLGVACGHRTLPSGQQALRAGEHDSASIERDDDCPIAGL